MSDNHPFIKWCIERHACKEGLRYVKQFRSPEDWWKRGNVASYMAWLAIAVRDRFWWKPSLHELCGQQFYFWGMVNIVEYDGPDRGTILKRYPKIPWKASRKKAGR